MVEEARSVRVDPETGALGSVFGTAELLCATDNAADSVETKKMSANKSAGNDLITHLGSKKILNLPPIPETEGC